jgi:hypothetical protein
MPAALAAQEGECTHVTKQSSSDSAKSPVPKNDPQRHSDALNHESTVKGTAQAGLPTRWRSFSGLTEERWCDPHRIRQAQFVEERGRSGLGVRHPFTTRTPQRLLRIAEAVAVARATRPQKCSQHANGKKPAGACRKDPRRAQNRAKS